MQHWSGRWYLIISVGAAMLSTTLAACGSIPLRSGLRSPQPAIINRQQTLAKTGWAAYFFPPVVGDRCILSGSTTTDFGDKLTTPGGTTETVLAVRSTGASIAYSIGVATTQANTPGNSTGIHLSGPQFVVHYEAMSDGSLLAPEASVPRDGIDLNTSDYILYPSVTSLLAGASRTSTVLATMSSTNPAVASQFAAATSNHSPTVRANVTFRVVGEPARRIVTPAGIFTNDVGVKVSLTGLSSLNVKLDKSEQSLMQAELKLFTPTTTLYWARGVGLVESISVSPLGRGTQLLQGCTRPRSPTS